VLTGLKAAPPDRLRDLSEDAGGQELASVAERWHPFGPMRKSLAVAVAALRA